MPAQFAPAASVIVQSASAVSRPVAVFAPLLIVKAMELNPDGFAMRMPPAPEQGTFAGIDIDAVPESEFFRRIVKSPFSTAYPALYCAPELLTSVPRNGIW